VYSDILYNFCPKNFSFQKWARYDQKRVLVLVKYPLVLSSFNKTWNFSTEFRKIRKYQISYISVKWSRVVPCGHIWRSFSLSAVLRTRLKAVDTKCAGTFTIYRFKREVITYSSGLYQTLFSTHRLAAVLLITINLGCINFPKLYEPPKNSIRQKGPMKFRVQTPRILGSKYKI
jgi:hypothetical protein